MSAATAQRPTAPGEPRKPLGQLHQWIGGLGPDHPPASEDDGVVGPGQKPAGPLDGFGVGPGGVRDEGGAASR